MAEDEGYHLKGHYGSKLNSEERKQREGDEEEEGETTEEEDEEEEAKKSGVKICIKELILEQPSISTGGLVIKLREEGYPISLSTIRTSAPSSGTRSGSSKTTVS